MYCFTAIPTPGVIRAMIPWHRLGTSVGACVAIGGEASVLQNGFGIVAMVAMVPLIAIESLGLVAIIKDKHRIKKATKRIVNENDDIIFEFLGGKENGR